ncbi:MAG TPA: cysteine desulfurase [Rhodospirillaceae bacterium]|nr:cysteine desulfurase [Rhodospirillaceae bacterium]MAX64108.1 cysteine desulfurase [Rhodospirillaceae bacterium]MBB57366.1 cysteine desulfurase [Rhodospirillaceae bacterium]HBM11737.1 cysteine desulfurase [Rhodospirillaceae bacterium]|tara:strand:- start:40416 stop:41549 length:1134 start_codon:yes stop_codon:yes gene_type:complete
MQTQQIYLDYNATSPVLPVAADAVGKAIAVGGNPSSIHGAGRAARALIEQARRQVAALVGARPGAVVFTSGASEANVLALRGLPRHRVLVSAIEHDSVLNAVPDAVVLPATAQGVIDLDALRQSVQAGDLVSVMAVNNETGLIQPIEDVAEIVKAAGALLHVDAVQAVGRLPFDIRALGLAALSLSAHKIGGPTGVGALVFNEGLALAAQTKGGGQEKGRRGGTENVAGIAGFGAAAEWVLDHMASEQARLSGLRDKMEQQLAQNCAGLGIIGADLPRVANTSCLSLPGVPAEKQVISLDLAGVCVSAGSACSSGKVKSSPVLTAMGLPADIAGSAIRVSLGWRTTQEDIDAFVNAYLAMAERLVPKDMPHADQATG